LLPSNETSGMAMTDVVPSGTLVVNRVAHQPNS
jgi:hypothetical protein